MIVRHVLRLIRGPDEWPAARTVFVAGDRVVWRGPMMNGCPLVLAGTYVTDGPAPRVTVRHDGSTNTAQVRPHQLYRESDYLARAGTRGYPHPTAWS